MFTNIGTLQLHNVHPPSSLLCQAIDEWHLHAILAGGHVEWWDFASDEECGLGRMGYPMPEVLEAVRFSFILYPFMVDGSCAPT